jgi:hypothetical protein
VRGPVWRVRPHHHRLRNGLNSRVQQALRRDQPDRLPGHTNSCVPLNLFGPDGSITDAMLAFIDPAAVAFRTRTSLGGVSASITGDFGWAIPLATNPVGIALGAEYRDYGAAIEPDLPSRTDNEVLGAGGAVQPVDGRYDVREVFAELIAPLDRGPRLLPQPHPRGRHPLLGLFDLGRQHRLEDRRILGADFEPQVPRHLPAGRPRPNIGELFTPRSLGLANSDTDPCQGALPVGNAQLTQACIASGAPASQIGNIAAASAGQINITFGGNLDLEPEDARTITVGAVFTPDFLPASRRRSIITTSSSPTRSLRPTSMICSTPATSSRSRRLRHDRPQPAERQPQRRRRDPGLPLFLSNSGRIDTSGLDISLNYRRDLGFGRIDIGFIANYTFDQKFQATPNSINRECVGFYSVNCGLSGSLQPEFQFNQRTTLSIGDLDHLLPLAPHRQRRGRASGRRQFPRGFPPDRLGRTISTSPSAPRSASR